jgi:hypothetical protein
MSNVVVFLAGFSLSLVAFGLLGAFIWRDYLKSLAPGKAMALLLSPHAFRHLGLLVLVPEVVGEPITKTAFASTLAYGDAVVAPLAVVLMALWLWDSGKAKALTWLFSIGASLDLLSAIFGALTLPVHSFAIGAFWIVLVCLVPLLVVTQAMIFARLSGK